ncbi:MAG: PAS domain S-box protein [Acidobacteria bacterium]|nr:PAS domain S-box protein [Acidobacteriota bacterium]
MCSTVVITFAIETLVHWLVSGLFVQPGWAAGLVDAVLLSIVVMPALYVFVFIPLHHAADREQAERALVESEARLQQADKKYRSIVDHAIDGIYQTTPDGAFITANDAMARLLGYTSTVELMAEVTDIASQSYVAPEGRAEFLRLFERDGVVEGLEYEIRRRDGSRRWVSENARAARDAGGVVQYYEGRLTDITERRLTQQALQDSERLLQESQLIAGLGSYVLDIPTGRWSSSTVLDTIFGIDDEYERSVDGWASLIHPEWQERMRRYFADEVLGQRGRFDMEYRVVRKSDGVARWVHGLGELEFDTQGHPLRMVGTISDITARRRAEEQIREQAELLDLAQDAIVVRDLEHRITYWNKSAERLYGWTAADAVGRSVPDAFYKNPEVFYEAHDCVFHKGEWTGEMRQLNKDGHEVTVESRWTLVRDRSGAPKSVLVINTDITARKQLEQQFLRAQRLESIGTLAGGIAHDLNNVLAPILMSIDLLKETASDDDRSLLDTIGASAQRGADMVTQVLGFARGMEGRRVEVQVRQVIRDMEQIAGETFPKNIRVRSTVSRDLWTVLGDSGQLHQVLLNLCINARDAMPEGGQILITAENVTFDAQYAARNIDATAGPHVVIHVEDTGTGIPQEIIDKVFDPFFTTKGVGQGTGLGLSTSRTIVKQHGGFLSVWSAPGKGTRFQICLPAQPGGGDKPAGAAAAELPRGDGEIVLVVDDEVAIREITRHTLEAFGYRVLLASDGAEAVALYTQHAAEIAVVIMDMMMPGLDGGSAIQALVTMNPAVRVIAVSGVAASSQALPKGAAGAIHFLVKPFSSETLLQALRQGLAKERQGNLNLFE